MEMKNFWFNLDDKIRFLLVGCFNAGVSYVIYSALCLLLGETSYQIALALSWAITSVVSFITQRNLVFEGNGVWYKEYAKCCTTWFFSYLINAGVLDLNVYLAQLISNFTAAVFTYIVFKKFAFKRKEV